MTKELQAKIRDSDMRIEAAIEYLRSSDRGTRTLKAFKVMCCDKGASGLDSGGFESLVTLTKELANGRRDFLERCK